MMMKAKAKKRKTLKQLAIAMVRAWRVEPGPLTGRMNDAGFALEERVVKKRRIVKF